MKLVGDGFVLLVLGQLVVFLFIFLMVAFINITAAVLRRFETPEPAEAVPAAEPVSADAEIVAAAAAVETFRSRI